MPNWCQNALTATGAPEHVAEFMAQPFCAARYIPTPEPAAVLREAFAQLPDAERDIYRKPWCSDDETAFRSFCYNHGGQQWCIKNWGTKWDWEPQTVTNLPQRAVIEFETAWTPPLPVVLAASRAHPEMVLALRFMEPMHAFRGEYVCAAGRCIREHMEGEDWTQ